MKRGYAGDTEGSADKLGYDLWYIRHRSLTVDLAICLRTIATVLRAEPHRFSATKSILLEGKSARPRERGLEVVSAAQAGSLGDSA